MSDESDDIEPIPDPDLDPDRIFSLALIAKNITKTMFNIATNMLLPR